MRINRGYRAARDAGMPAKIRPAKRKAGQAPLAEGPSVVDRIREKGQLAVQQLERMDSAYAQAVAGAVNSANNPMLGDLVAQPLSNPYKMPTDQYESLGHAGVPMMNVRSKQREDFARPQEMLANATNFGARYVVPGAGIALAAKGIGDVAFGGPSDQQEPNQLDMVNVAGLTAAGAGVAVAPGLVNKFRGKPVSGAATFGGMAALGAGGGALTSAIVQSL